MTFPVHALYTQEISILSFFLLLSVNTDQAYVLPPLQTFPLLFLTAKLSGET